ncbi:MAG: site-2 protease family protein [Hyphomicrobiaceae bacterium]|nr:site-2 protease family protein [Hyphomicrobiaceae bacterium]
MRQIFELIGNILRGIGAAVSRDKRRRYSATVMVDAPQSLVWRISAQAHAADLNEESGLKWTASERSNGSGIVDVVGKGEDFIITMAYRVRDSRPPQAQLIEILHEGENVYARSGRDYYIAYTLRPEGDRTELTMTHELTHSGGRGYLLVPWLPMDTARAVKRRAETAAGTVQYNRGFGFGAVATGVLTLASFIPWFGLSGAAIMIALIFVHEFGHVAAMRSLGLPVRGIYFVPFFGGVAVGAAARTEAERGYVSLMGPGLSLATTALLYFWGMSSGSTWLTYAALLSALINGFNLLPVTPLDGGHVFEALLSRVDPGVVGMIKLMILLVALSCALYMGWMVMTVLFALAIPGTMVTPDEAARIPPVSLSEGATLAAGYAGSLAFYALVVMTLMGNAAA